MQLTRVPVTVDEELLLLRELVACLVDRVGDDDYAEAAGLLEDVTTRISTPLDGREQPTPETPVPLPAAGNRITGVAESIVAGVPRDAVAGVITRGEQALLDTPGRTCRHFP